MRNPALRVAPNDRCSRLTALRALAACTPVAGFGPKLRAVGTPENCLEHGSDHTLRETFATVGTVSATVVLVRPTGTQRIRVARVASWTSVVDETTSSLIPVTQPDADNFSGSCESSGRARGRQRSLQPCVRVVNGTLVAGSSYHPISILWWLLLFLAALVEPPRMHR